MLASVADPGLLVVLFDGECQFCSNAVRFVIARDPRQQLRFASLQSEFGKQVAMKFQLAELDSSLLLLERGALFRESTAALRIARRLRMPWCLLYALITIPRPLRNLVYRFVARRRIRWFGRCDVCTLLDVVDRGRFIEDADASVDR